MRFRRHKNNPDDLRAEEEIQPSAQEAVGLSSDQNAGMQPVGLSPEQNAGMQPVGLSPDQNAGMQPVGLSPDQNAGVQPEPDAYAGTQPGGYSETQDYAEIPYSEEMDSADGDYDFSQADEYAGAYSEEYFDPETGEMLEYPPGMQEDFDLEDGRELQKRARAERWSGVRMSRVLIWTMALVLTAVAVTILLLLIPKDDMDVDSLLEETTVIRIETEPETTEPERPEKVVPRPDIDEQLLTVNEFSRPGEKCDAIEYVVIHYLANPKTTAQQNHDYFESLKDLQDVSMSANFIVGLEGEIIECVPPGEIAYASNSMNHLSVSIENCHLDQSGRFTEDTYSSLVKLTAWVVSEYDLDRDHIIRHYDVTGKECPIYYVRHEDKWEAFKDDVMNYIEECRKAAEQG